ncbi:MAG: hypothetical protein AB7S54_05615 [Bacteroidales bacterium]
MGNHKNTIFQYWTKNLVESSSTFSFNLSVSLLSGILYSFKVIQSNYLLLIFGVVSPIIFTVCLYDLLLNSNGELMGQPLPRVFLMPSWSRLVMFFDCSIIVLFATLIYLDLLNYFLFRFLQTVFFPILLLVMLKSFYFIINHQE